LRDSLADAGAVVALAELHGGICGALCAGGVPAAQRWLEDSLDDEELAGSTAGLGEELAAVVGASATMLAGDEFKFEPLLPDDAAPLEERVQALALWCHGFLGGVGMTAARTAPSEALAEILRDFAEISRAALSEDEAAGGDEPAFALAEIHEYVRASVQLVFEELGAERSVAPRDVH
jgi:uncharacterized protein YgfB (UPF0149 family)